jgi:hypothetical protein
MTSAYVDGIKTAAKHVSVDLSPEIISLLHAAPIPFTSAAAAVYEGLASPDKHYIRRPVTTSLATLLGDAAGRALASGFSQDPVKSERIGELGAAAGRYLASRLAQGAQDD